MFVHLLILAALHDLRQPCMQIQSLSYWPKDYEIVRYEQIGPQGVALDPDQSTVLVPISN